jgi:hypothetical protein
MMSKAALRALLVAGMLGLAGTPAWAQRLELSVTPVIVLFPSQDPDVVPLVSAPPMTITIRVRGNGNQPWQLSVLASGNLMSGPSSVDITNVTWVATPAPPFRTGTMSRTVAQIVAAGTGNVNPTLTGSVTFRLNNSWTYDSGLYLQTVVFTLAAP